MTSIDAASNHSQRTPQEIAKAKYHDAKDAASIPGELCKFVGSIGSALGGFLFVLSIGTGDAGTLAVTGGITALAALAGAPVAALGSIATQTKKSTKFAELDAYIKREGLN